MEPEQINRAEKQALDLFLGGDTQTYQAPAESAEDFIARGLIDETGAATEKGDLFLQLRDRGLIKPDGQFTERGLAYGMPAEESEKPENLWAFRKRTEDGVDKPEASLSDMIGGVAEFAWDAGAGATTAYLNSPMSITGAFADEDETALNRIAVAEGMAGAWQQFGDIAALGAGLFGEAVAPAIGMQKEAEDTMWMARQNFARTNRYLENAKAGKIIEDVTGVSKAVEFAAEQKSMMPPEEYAAITKQGRALGSLADPTTFLPMGAAAKVGKLGVISRAGIKADRVLAEVAAIDRAIAAKGVESATLQAAAAKSATKSELATRIGNSISGPSSQRAQGIAAKATEEAAQRGAMAAKLGEEAAELAAKRESLAVRIPENVAMATQKAIEIGRSAKALPVQAVGQALEKTGNGIIYLNDQLKDLATRYGLGEAYKAVRLAAPITGISALGPAGAIPSAILASGVPLRGAGRFSQIVGRELSNARGQVPFWQRVANYPDLSPIHRGLARLTDTATMGGALPNAVRTGAKGISAAYPIDLAFEFLADGGDPNADTFKRAFAQSLVLGGSSAMLGGMFEGTKARHRELALGDELNFRQDLDPDQKSYFNAMPSGARRSVATYAASNPQLKIVFNDGSTSSYSHGNLTATIGLNSTNPLGPLISHEVLHHTIIRNQMEDSVTALLLGDGESGGLLRSNDGNLSKDFKDAWDAYNRRMTAAGNPPIGMKDAAMEYYIETSADYVSEMAESGELGSIAGRTDAGRGMRKIVEALTAKMPIIRDMHFKLGGQIDPEGRIVMGNGLLAEGLRENPHFRAMTRQMIRQSSGRSQGLFKTKGVDDMGGVALPMPQKGDPMIDKMIAFYDAEEVNGQTRVKKDTAGNPVPLDPELNQDRAEIGIDVLEALEEQGVKLPEGFTKPERKKRRGKPRERKKRPETATDYTKATAEESTVKGLPDEVVGVAENGDLVLRGLSDATLDYLRKKGILNSEQMRILREINRAARAFDGSNYFLINHPALDANKKYASLEASLRDAVPLDIRITKKGNLTVALMSVTKLHENVTKFAQTNRGKKLYQGNREAILNDLNSVMELHNQEKGTEEHFKKKHGTQWEEYRNFCNTVFGQMTKSQRTGVSRSGDVWTANPLFEIDNISGKDQVFRTYRLDRISQATKATGDSSVKMPFVYEAVKMNLMPNGLPENL